MKQQKFNVLLLITIIKVVAANFIASSEESTPLHPDVNLTTPDIIKRHGYAVETHTVISGGGYILTMHRMPNTGKTPVYLNHGFLGSSADFVLLGPGQALAYVLYDAGFDVWMGNVRGNVYSKKHTSISSSDIAFWQYCMHDTASVDLPNNINYILDKTSKTKIDYIGFSMGSMELFIMMDQRPEYNSKINQAHLLAPVAYMGRKGRFFNILKTATSFSTWTLDLLNTGEFGHNRNLYDFSSVKCVDTFNIGLCNNVYTFLITTGSQQINRTMASLILSHNPASSSVKVAKHFGDLMDIDKFQQFDYGSSENMKKYGSKTPPLYELSKTTVPVYIYYTKDDIFAEPHNVKKMCDELSNCKEMNFIQNYVHGDFLYASNVKTLIYDGLVTKLKV